jgi:hypothetical protein
MRDHYPSKIKKNRRVRKEHRLDYQIEVQHDEGEKEWYVRRYGLESLEEARQYLKEHNHYKTEKMRIVTCEFTTVTTIVEYDLPRTRKKT